MKNVLSRLQNKVFIRFLLSYFLVLLIPVCINLYVHQLSLETIKEYTIEFNTTQLTEAMDTIDGQLTDLNNIALQISNDRSVRNLMNYSFAVKGTKFLEYNACVKVVNNFLLNKGFVNGPNYYIYFKNSDYIMTQDTIYRPELYFWSLIKKYKPDYEDDYKKWIQAIKSDHFTTDYYYADYDAIGYNEIDKVIYMKTVPMRIDKKNQGTFVVEFDKANLRKLIKNPAYTGEGSAYIEDENGRKIVTTGEKEFVSVPIDFSQGNGTQTFTVDGEKMIATYVVSTENGWRYVTLIPEVILYSELQNIQGVYFILLFLILAVGIVVAVLFTNSNSKPILKATSYISDFFGEDERVNTKDPYKTITTGVAKLISNQIAMQADINNQKPYLRNSFFNNLLLGQFYNENEIYAIAKYLDIDISGEGFYVAAIRTYNDDVAVMEMTEKNIEEVYIWKSIVRSTFYKYFGNHLLMHDSDPKRLALMFSPSQENVTAEEFVTMATKVYKTINEELQSTYNMNIFIGMGGYCQTANDMWRSYEQAEQALDFAWDKNDVVWYDDISLTDKTYYYPQEVEQRIINFAKTGEYSQIVKSIDIVYHENFVLRNLSIYIYKEFIGEMRSTLNKLLPQIQDPLICARIKNVGGRKNVLENFEDIKEIYLAICESSTNEKNKNNRQFINGVKEYIENNYSDSELGLYKIASNFNLSEGYFSSVFKEQIGVNFTEYLEQVRLDKSIELLENSNYTIDTIAQMVGYNSSQSYRRAFKKIHGSSPNVLRSDPKK